MSNSATAPTSTTASSPNSASDAVSGDVRATAHRSYLPSPVRATHPGEHDHANGRQRHFAAAPAAEPDDRVRVGGAVDDAPSREPVEIVACGALAGHIREIAARRGWPVTVRPLPAALHNRPQKIKASAERLLASPQARHSRAVLAYADCGTYGALDDLAEETGARRLPGLHCFDLYAGPDAIERLFAEEPGTYLLTDYLIRSFDRAVIQPLGLDRHPELWTDYFGHYQRLVWLAQQPTAALEEAASRIAGRFNLPLTRVPTGTTGLEAALAELLEEKTS